MSNNLGARVACAVCGAEFLVTRPGDGFLSCCATPVVVRRAGAVGSPPASPATEADGSEEDSGW